MSLGLTEGSEWSVSDTKQRLVSIYVSADLPGPSWLNLLAMHFNKKNHHQLLDCFEDAAAWPNMAVVSLLKEG